MKVYTGPDGELINKKRERERAEKAYMEQMMQGRGYSGNPFSFFDMFDIEPQQQSERYRGMQNP